MSGKPTKRHSVTQPRNKPYRFIPLTQGQTTIVDVRDFIRVARLNWTALWSPTSKSFYAVGSSRDNLHVGMHNFILRCKGSEQGDHKNHDTLDNRSDNTSGYKGVSFEPSRGKWRARINFQGRSIGVGRFVSIEEAALAYNQAARKYFGEFALLNHLIS